MKTVCIIAMAIFVTVHFLSAVLDVGNKNYAPNLLLAVAELIAFVGCFNIF